MSHAKRTSKRRSRLKAVTVLGIAGVLLAGSASAALVAPTGEEEISSVNLATSDVFDKENAAAHRPGLQLARQRGRGDGRGSAVYRGYGIYQGSGGGAYGGGGGATSGGAPDGT